MEGAMLKLNKKVYVYIGLDREGNVIEFLRMGDPEGKGKTIKLSSCKTENELETETVGNGHFELMRKKATAPAAKKQKKTRAPGDREGIPPCCVRLPNGQIKCFC
jgi:hypothetical protein